MSDETEITTETEAPDETAAAAAALREGGDEVAALKLELAARDRKIARQDATIRKTELTGYKAELATEFEYADPELITGKTKAEMRATAERLHNAVAKVIEKKGLKPGTPVEKKVPTAEDFGAPPAVAVEAASGETPIEFAQLSEMARTGKMTRAQVLADIAKNGPRQIDRPTIASAVQRRSEAAKTA